MNALNGIVKRKQTKQNDKIYSMRPPGCILYALKSETTFQMHRNQRTTLEKSKQIIIQTCSLTYLRLNFVVFAFISIKYLAY